MLPPPKILAAILSAAIITFIVHAAAFAQDIGADVADATDELVDPNVIANWEIILAFVLPLIVSVLTKANWPDWKKAVAAFTISAVITAVGMYLAGEFSGNLEAVATVLRVFALTIPFYYGLWKPVGTTAAIHKATG